MITVSIVSHGHGHMVSKLLMFLISFPEVKKIVLTKNIPEFLYLPSSNKVICIENTQPKGFASNHNEAFKHCQGDFFCVMNPDIDFENNPFPPLLNAAIKYHSGLAVPFVKDSSGKLEDSIRYFPRFSNLILKLLGVNNGSYKLQDKNIPFSPECVAGMFMLFTKKAYSDAGGFDEQYFLYYEDMDICIKLWSMQYSIIAVPAACVIHNARRASRKNLRHLSWHISSMSRYFFRYCGRLPRVKSVTL